MIDPDEHGLVIRALRSGLSNCLCWKDDQTLIRVKNDPDLQGLAPSAIKQLLKEFVAVGGLVVQKPEGRPGHRDHYRFYYKAIIPFDGCPRGLFVEFVLADDDPDFPVVHLGNAHPQGGS